MREEIIDKLINFLKKDNPMTEECQVVYLMVEIRKLLDRVKREEGRDYSILRFYCDWTVHTDKKRITPEIKDIMQKIDVGMPPNEKFAWLCCEENMSFIYMKELKREMEALFKSVNLPMDIFQEKNWLSFISLFTRVLIDQPIVNPTENIESFSFLSGGREGVGVWEIKFKDIRGTHRFANLYF